MTKNIVREIIIILLLCLAIILLLGILLYEYVPMNKTVPNTEAYTTPSNVKSELKEENANGDLIQTYEINNSDLDDYKRVQNYKPGKADPFSSYKESENNTTGSSSSGSSTTVIGSNGVTSSNTSSGDNSTSNTNSTQTNNNNETDNNSQNSTTNDNSTSSSGGHFYKDTGTK